MIYQEYTKEDFSKNYMAKLLSAMPGGFFVYCADFDREEILYANRALLGIYDCETSEEFMELTGGSFKGMVHEADYEAINESILTQINSNAEKMDQVTYRIRTRCGVVKYVNDYGRYYEDPDFGPLFFVFIEDTDFNTDHLTGLLNRAGFLAIAEKLKDDYLSEGDKPTIVAFDFKGMKGFNARYGLPEGDNILRIFASILSSHFGRDCCSRFGEDHFYAVAKTENLQSHLEAIIEELSQANDGRTLPVKIGLSEYQREISLNSACDRARMACEAQKSVFGSSIGNYTEKMSEQYLKNEYILTHLDEAIEKGWIIPYVQPIVRTLSGRVCGAEALTRWIDPIQGFISPGDFIPLLESNGLSYKLDAYMIRRVAEKMGQILKAGMPIVPVSVNISRADFDYCDPVQIVTDALDEYGVRHSLMSVEITESAFMADTEFLKEAIERFHDAGIEVKMDDFGSGYSSLNILKNFNFDEIKIDMLFMRSFDERSKVIIKKTVQLAKEIGMHTLAEGVETEEQVEFLKEIGCEKIQGYYYFKPDLYEHQVDRLKEKNLTPETKDENVVYEQIGKLDLISDVAIGLFYYDGENFHSIHENQHYKDLIQQTGISVREAVEKNMNQRDSILRQRFRALAERTAISKETEYMNFVLRDRYYQYTFKEVTRGEKGQVLYATIDDMVFEERELSKKLDGVLRNVVSLYDAVYLVDLNEDTRTVILSNVLTEHEGDVEKGLHEFYARYTPRTFHPEDVARWKEFTSREYIQKGFSESEKGFYQDAFRVKDEDGNFVWKNFFIAAIPESDGKRFLVCVQPSTIEKYNQKFTLESTIGDEAFEKSLLDALLTESGIRFFWKDINRRFVGVTQAFLDYYGFTTDDRVIGKNDEEMRWHTNDSFYRENEIRVLTKGEIIRNSPGQNIVKGVVHNIAATKFPVYQNGKIIGLMGYMIDIDDDIKSESALNRGSMIDQVTGMMNANGQLVVMMGMDENLHINKEDYIYIAIDVPEYAGILDEFSASIAEELIKKVSKVIQTSFGPTAIIFRENDCRFGVVMRSATLDKIESAVMKCVDAINDIKEVSNRKCRVHAKCGIAHGAEGANMQEVIELAKKRGKERKDS